MNFNLSNNSAITINKFDTMADLARDLIPALTSGSVALSGGSTYKSLYKEWAKLPIDLSDNWYCAADERIVSFEHKESNWGTAGRQLFKPLGVPEQNHNHYITPGYLQTLLRNRFDTDPYIFDTIFLGVGEDGHTASIFPNSPEAENFNSSIVTSKSPAGIQKRISLGLKVITDAKEVIMIITGGAKEKCIEWLIASDMTKPFVSALARREHSTLYLDANLYEKMASQV